MVMCCLIEVDRRFRGAYCLYQYSPPSEVESHTIINLLVPEETRNVLTGCLIVFLEEEFTGSKLFVVVVILIQ
jgi:hypothetical protein